MSRIIDADKAIEWIDINYPKLDRQDMKQMLNAQPTAYDIDKVVEQLENASCYIEDGNGHAGHLVFTDKAIEIVKGSAE